MAKETFEELSTDEFNQLVDEFITREDDRIAPSTFLKAVAKLERRRTAREVELTGRVVNGEVIFDTPAPLLVETNTLYVGDTKVRLRLRSNSND